MTSLFLNFNEMTSLFWLFFYVSTILCHSVSYYIKTTFLFGKLILRGIWRFHIWLLPNLKPLTIFYELLKNHIYPKNMELYVFPKGLNELLLPSLWQLVNKLASCEQILLRRCAILTSALLTIFSLNGCLVARWLIGSFVDVLSNN
jgi:hypothetical protein